MAGPEQKQKTLEERVQELEDVREINEVFRLWHHGCTGGFGGLQAGREESLECLTEDATIEIEGLHKPGEGPRGREAYTRYWDYYYGDAGPLPYVFQTSLDQNVTVNGDTAVQTSNQIILNYFREGGWVRLGMSRRVNDLVRTPDGWKIKKTYGDAAFSVPLVPIEKLEGPMNDLPPMEQRTPWTYPG